MAVADPEVEPRERYVPPAPIVAWVLRSHAGGSR